MRDTLSFLTFAFALALIMATALFASVGVNPKDDSYGRLPWIYAGSCLIAAAACGLASRRLDKRTP